MKRFLGMLIAVMLVFPFATAFAQEDTDTISLSFEDYEVGENLIEIYASTNATELPTSQQLTVMLSGNELSQESILGIADSGKPTTHLFLIDVSGSISDAKMEQIKEIISLYVQNIGQGDNVSVMRVGTELYTEPFVSAQEVEAQVEALQTDDNETNLYAGTINAIEILQTDESVHKSKVLTVISDGEEYSPVGYTLEEAQDEIEDSNIKVNTVAMLDSGASDAEIEDSKILGSFARASAGGSAITSGLNDEQPADIAELLIDSRNETFVLSCDISTFTAPTDETLLEMSLSIEGRGTATDAQMLSASSVMQGVVPTPTPEPTEQPTPEQTVEPTPMATEQTEEADQQEGIMGFMLGLFGGNETTMWIVIAAVGAVIIGGVILIIVIVNKKKKQEQESKAKMNSKPAQPVQKSANDGKTIPVMKSQEKAQKQQMFDTTPRVKYKLTFTKLGKGKGESFSFDMAQELIIGRNSSVAQFSMSSDDLLSSRHCRVFESGDSLLIEDLNSTNGTYLNGVPVSGAEKLAQDDIILAGSMELRIEWQHI